MLRSVHNEYFAMESGALSAFVDRAAAITPALISALEAGKVTPGEQFIRTDDGTAKVFVSGALLRSTEDALLFRRFGEEATSYGEIRGALAAANADPSISRVLLVIDSPGGQVSGVHDAADAIAKSGKPVAAHIETLGASAAYWLASQAAGGISAGRGAQVGSIGAYMAIVDQSQAAANAGIKVHVISSGPHKGAGVPGAAITTDQLMEFQAGIDSVAAQFVADVAAGRGVDAARIKESADGRVYSSEEAKGRGLIDRISFDPEQERKMLESAAIKEFAGLIKEHGAHAALISDMLSAGANAGAVRGEIAKLENDARLAGIEKDAADAKAALGAEKAERVKADAKVAELEAALVVAQAATDALKALGEGAKASDGVKADPPKQEPIAKTADEVEAMAGAERAAYFAAGGKLAPIAP